MISCGGSDDDVTVSTNRLFVTVGNNGIILTSSDGISSVSYTHLTLPTKA